MPDGSFPPELLTRAIDRPARRGGMSPILYGSIGFLSGVVFWHFVGFWSFVSAVVYEGRQDANPVAIVRKNDVRPRETASAGSAAGDVTSCVRLVLDRVSGATTSSQCRQSDSELPHLGMSERSDSLKRAISSAIDGWTVTAERDTNR